jgi:hypothetical protein
MWISCCYNSLENLVSVKLSTWAIIEQMPLNLLGRHGFGNCGETCGDKSIVNEGLKLQNP